MTPKWMGWMAVLAVALLSSPLSAEEKPAPKPPQQASAQNASAAKTPQAKAAAQQAPAPKAPPDKPKAEENSVLKTSKAKTSYGLGVSMARILQRQGIEVEADLVMKGLWDALAGEKLLMTEQELSATSAAMQAEARQKLAQAKVKAAEENKKAGEAFLAQNKTKEGVVALPNGIQYKILKAGSGKKPTDSDTVECHYRGALIDGTEFGNSHRSGKPATIKLAKVIPGWKEALKLMPVGSKWQIFIPSQLGYGARGTGRGIGPNTALVFDVELLAIKPPEAAQNDGAAAAPGSGKGETPQPNEPQKIASPNPG